MSDEISLVTTHEGHPLCYSHFGGGASPARSRRARILRYLEQTRVITLASDADGDVLSVSKEPQSVTRRFLS